MSPKVDVVHLFCRSKAVPATTLKQVLARLRPDAAIWVSWPKKVSKAETDIREDVIRTVALPMHLVDTKISAVDNVCSGLKLVIRVKYRNRRG